MQVMSGGVVSLVCSAVSRGQDVVVKLSPRVAGGERLRTEGAALVFWRATGGAVALHAVAMTATRCRSSVCHPTAGSKTPTSRPRKCCASAAMSLVVCTPQVLRRACLSVSPSPAGRRGS